MLYFPQNQRTNMKKNYTKLALFTLSVLFAVNTFSQDVIKGQDASKIIAGSDLIRTSKYSSLPSYVQMQQGKGIVSSQFRQWMKDNMKMDPSIDFKIIKVEGDQLGMIHTRLQQTYHGIPVETGTWITHAKNNVIQSMNGLIFKTISASTTPSITESEALEKAKQFVGADQYKWELPEEEAHLKWESGDPNATYFPKAELVFSPRNFIIGADNFRLAYKFNIYAQAPLYRSYVYVDAITGEIIGENAIIHHVDTPGTAITAYSGSQPIIADSFGGSYRLRDASRGLGIRTYDLNTAYGYGGAVDFTDADNTWNNVNPQKDEYATDVHWATEKTYDYFNDIHGRNSIDGAGFQLNSYVHYGINYVNAYWDGTRMTYGDGNGAPYTPLTSIDIAGHEITHGLTNFTANLIYYGESGALNESFSDIFGTAIENYSRPADWDWLMSDDIGAPFRSLQNPNMFGHPDTYFGTFWQSLVGPDNGGVHSNSGVQNYWYYLLVAGGTGTNDIGDAFDVSGIGFTSANAIAFRNLTVYLTDGSDHADARFFAIQSAIDLFGACSIEEVETTNAWYAVGVGPEYVTIVDANFSSTIGCFPAGVVDFSDLSTAGAGVIDTWDWDFGDGGTAAVANPSHTFAGTGTYPVELRVMNDLGCEDLFTFDVTVFDAPNADFSAVAFCEGDLTAFTDASTIASGTITGWEWDFGDASSSLLTDPTHTFGTFGTFDVKLVAISNNGCEDSLIVPITINARPIADFTFTDNCENVDAVFTNTSTSPDGGVLSDFTWDFGDGSPTVTLVSPTHDYATLGDYVVTLDVVSDSGCTNSVSYTITQFSIPSADFSVADVCMGDDAVFSDLSTILAPEVIAGLSWEFGDGGTGIGGTPTHIYLSSGVFDVTLTATSSNGCEDEITLPITIHAAPDANFSATTVCVNGAATNFTDLSTIVGGGSITGWTWLFDDGSGSALENPIKKYTMPGVYDAELTVVSDFGCEDVITIPVTVYEKPTANFTSDVTEICSPDCVEFTSLSSSATSDITAWKWSAEDGSTSTSENPRICFSAVVSDQLYDIELIVSNDLGCKDTLTVIDFVGVNATPVASFTSSPTQIDVFDTETFFTNTSDYASSFIWDFGDYSATSNDVDPIHIYPQVPGTYPVTLQAFSSNGLCTSVAKGQVVINDVIIYYIPNTFTPDGDTYNETFKPWFISGYNPYDFHLTIFNRYGEIIFETYDASYGWNGAFGDQGLVESGVYIWSLEFRETQTDKRHKDTGHVTVLK